MTSTVLLSKIIYTAFPVFLGYFLILTFFYLILSVIGLLEGKRRAWESEEEDYPAVYFTAVNTPVSVIIPAHNEEEWIKDSLLAAVNLNYPQFEVIVVDDKSTDRTFDILNEILDLSSVDTTYIKHYQDGKVRDILKSAKYPNVTVIRKFAGKKKAGAVNAALNIARYKYVCTVDSDTVLEPDSMLKVMAHVEKDPDRIIGIGSYFGLSNGFTIENGRIIKRHFPLNPIIAYQNLEYIRSFMGNRLGWSRFNAMPVVAGGFGIWRKDVLYELGGYSAEFTCEDIELTFRAHDYMAKNRDKKYRILMLPYYVCWTEGPQNIGGLILQRNRWQRVTNETVWAYKYMLFNPRYGAFGFITLPYFIMYETLGVFFEVLSVAMVTVGWAFGILDVRAFIAFLVFMILWQNIISSMAIFAFIRTQKLFKTGYLIYLLFLSFVEFLFYRWIISLAKLLGTFASFKKTRTFDQYQRAKRVKK